MNKSVWSQQPGERPRFMSPCRLNCCPSAIPATCWQLPSEAFFHRTQHDILHCFVTASGTAAQSMISCTQQSCAKRHTQLFAIITAELKAIPSTSAGYFQLLLLPLMGPLRQGAAGDVQRLVIMCSFIMRYTRFALTLSHRQSLL